MSVNPYLTFSSSNSFTLGVVDNQKYWDGSLEYSTDTNNWSTWDGTSAISSASDGTKHNLYMRGTGNSVITGTGASNTAKVWAITGTNVSISGNISKLLDYQSTPTVGSSAFYFWFGRTTTPGNVTALTDLSGLVFDVIGDRCYKFAFAYCTSIVNPPSLPLTTLNVECYNGLFIFCSSLTSAPSLPSTTLSDGCYMQMFYGCTSLTSAPTLPATTLADGCYMNMFYNCSALVTPPTILPATNLPEAYVSGSNRLGCYTQMFYGCTSLTTAPALPATNLSEKCYYGMFYGCTSLITVPQIIINNLGTTYSGTDGGCCAYMFQNCTALVTISIQLNATTLYDSCYRQMFFGCTSLTSAPELPATTLANSCYRNMFQGCSSLTIAPSLPATILTDYCYAGMFFNCTSLITIPSILPATTLSEGCCYDMFYNCTSLTTVPELPATTLANSCYREMFYNCTNIKLSTIQTGDYTKEFRIPKEGTGTDASSALYRMFSGTGGRFTGTASINTTYYLWVESQPQLSVELTRLSGWSNVSVGSHTLKVKAKATGYRDSALSSGVSFERAAPVTASKCTVAGLGSSSPSSVTFTKDAGFTVAGLGIKEVTKGTDVFIKIPTMYRKVESVSDNQITSFTIANVKIDNNYQPYSCFIDENGAVMEYILIGKYWNTEVNRCVSTTEALATNMLVDTGRNCARAKGAGYQLFDWQMWKLWQDLIICFKMTVNTNTGTEWTYDEMGIYWITQNGWIDGVMGSSGTWKLCTKPSKYASLSSESDPVPADYVSVGYSQPTTTTSNQEISKLGYDANYPFFNFLTAIVGSNNYNTYYCDGYYYDSGNRPVFSDVGSASASYGAFNCHANNNWSSAHGVRLCYRPVTTS